MRKERWLCAIQYTSIPMVRSFLRRHSPFILILCMAVVSIVGIGVLQGHAMQSLPKESKLHASISEPLLPRGVTLSPTPIPTQTPKPTPVYPPQGWHCIRVPILMYHHVAPLEEARAAGHAALTVDAGIFASQLQAIKAKGYTPTTLLALSAYFDAGTALPQKPIILTFDDAYDDFYHHAFPALQAHNFPAELFVPTGLIENPGYMTWEQVKSASRGGVTIGHHTWSHAQVAKDDAEFFTRELDVPMGQLEERGLGPVRFFAYPYGTTSNRAVREVAARKFSLAVTTKPGVMQCKEDRLLLHRTRMGNGSIGTYGL